MFEITDRILITDRVVSSVLAASLAGLISIVGLVISKQLKISDFRKAWIDDLRTEIAAVCAHSLALIGLAAIRSTSTQFELWKASREDFEGLNKAASAIRMRLNHDEPNCKSVLGALTEIEEMLSAPPIKKDALCLAIDRLVLLSRPMLKGEWVRVKRGEKAYRRTLYAVGGFVVVGIVCMFIPYIVELIAAIADLLRKIPAAAP